MYTQVRDGSTYVDEHRTKLGIRTIQFNRSDGKFYLNGQALKLRGLDRHESYPYIGRAAPNRLQTKDADILKRELGVNSCAPRITPRIRNSSTAPTKSAYW